MLLAFMKRKEAVDKLSVFQELCFCLYYMTVYKGCSYESPFVVMLANTAGHS